ncbi:phage tail protein [Actinomycetospora succinea]|uniref:phage tail protein n=1 Tax=Actinomycetospora succinea TaxID=663603 RepID=UPI00141521FF|nr:phage tail protein [Actinomycetospora succinea]
MPFSAADFLVEIEGIGSAGFSRVLLPRQELRTVPYRNGGDGQRTTFAPAGAEVPDHFVVTRGVTADTSLWDWWQETRAGGGSARRASVVLLDESQNEQARWNLVDCDPVAYWLSPLDATLGEVLTETLCMTTGGMDRA